MDSFVNILSSNDKVTSTGDVPSGYNKRIFVPAYSWNEKHYYYLIDTENKAVKRWVVDIHTAKTKLKTYMKENHHYTWRNKLLDALEFSFVPHSSIYHHGKIYVSSVNSYYMIVLDAEHNTYDIILDNEMKMISSTNVIMDDHIIYVRYSAKNRVDNVQHGVPLQAETVRYNLNDKTYTVINRFECNNIVHSVSITPDNKYIISVATTSDPYVAFTENPKAMYQDKPYMRKMLEKGLKESQIHIYDIEKNTFKVIELNNTPAHIEHDLHDPSLCYISSHSLGVNQIDGFIYSFGKSSINKLKLQEESIITDTYESMDFLRIPSHKLFTYNNRKLIAATVFPQQIHIIDYHTMEIYKKIYLDKAIEPVDFSDGPFKYPRADKTPFSVHPISESPYMYFVGGKSIKLYNQETDKTECVIHYNKNNDPIAVLGHSVIW
ncbi:hypothetical protein HZI73_05780 [Vallitalea pronyensis]|uniref:Uncharacterized protein n=1 Tax=Vallitalea pronyensis TaxID=1348613 RepID=A0A8J8SFQ2_9FIRM|nr:hypothetical protein [Vallitalea pronyensis]QUI21836.1 hypothetical protein HZI73_05780 [Vallitalea pronyensis]